jgi:hypothetical protein
LRPTGQGRERIDAVPSQSREISHEEPPEEAAPDTLLAPWTAVFPLSHGPAHRVRLDTGPDVGADIADAITADYLRELSERVPDGCWISVEGDLHGPPDFVDAPRDVLFTAVFTTDLARIVRRNSPSLPGGPYPESDRPASPFRSTTK